MTTAPPLKLVVDPATSFVDLNDAVNAIGFSRCDDAPVTTSLLPGEPEFARWAAPDGVAQLYYSFNPVVLLRVLVVSGDSAAKWRNVVAERIRLLTTDEVRGLLAAQHVRDTLLGLYAAAELVAFELLPAIDSLRLHANQRVSETAAKCSQKLALALLEVGAERIAEDQRRRPGYSALFGRLGDATVRRATLLWLLHDIERPNAEIVKVLRTALADADWHVRVTAMLVAARMKAVGVWEEIRFMQMPPVGPKGLDRRFHSLLAAVRKAVLAELAGDEREGPNDERSRFRLHLRMMVSGEEDGIRDEAREWIEGWLRMPSHEPAQQAS